MSRHRSMTVNLGTALLALNLLAWAAWAATRPAYTTGECAVLQARRAGQDAAGATGTSGIEAYTRTDHLLFARPLHPLASEILPVKALYVANALPLIGAWSFLVPSSSNVLGPT